MEHTQAEESSAASVADGERKSLDPAQIEVETTVCWIVTLLVMAPLLTGLLLCFVFGWFPGWLRWLLVLVLGLVASLLCWLSLRWPALEHRRCSYRVGALGIEIWRGVIWRSTISVPRSRVQHTDVSQGPLQRKHGLATLSIHTAGKEHARVDLPGLRRETALRIRDFLIQRGSHGAG